MGGQGHVHPAGVAQVDVGVVVGGVGGPGDGLHEGGAGGEPGRHEVGVQGVDEHPPVAEGRVGGDLGRRHRRVGGHRPSEPPSSDDRPGRCSSAPVAALDHEADDAA